jgi:hypothetical protein
MILKLVGAAEYRGTVDGHFVELARGEELKVSPEAGQDLLESFPAWFESSEREGQGEAEAAPARLSEGREGQRQERGGKRDRMQRGTAQDRQLEEQAEEVRSSGRPRGGL